MSIINYHYYHLRVNGQASQQAIAHSKSVAELNIQIQVNIISYLTLFRGGGKNAFGIFFLTRIIIV